MKFKLTPIQTVDQLYIKRDDLFTNYSRLFNGGKLRQAINLISNELKEIVENYNSTIITSSGVNGSTGCIFAEVANHFNLNCILLVGATNEKRLKELIMMRLAKSFNADIRIVSNFGFSSTINKSLYEIAEKEKYFALPYNYKTTEMEDFTLINSEQVKNLPTDLDNLVIPCGTGIQMSSVLIGLEKFNIKVKRIYGVMVGPNREENIRAIYNFYSKDIFPKLKFSLVQYSDKQNYSEEFDLSIKDIKLDKHYEAKAYFWLLNNLDYKSEKTCLWLSGRHPTKEESEKYLNEQVLSDSGRN